MEADDTNDTNDTLDYVFGTVDPTSDKNLIPGNANTSNVPSPVDGYTHVYVGNGTFSNYWAGYVYRTDGDDYAFCQTLTETADIRLMVSSG